MMPEIIEEEEVPSSSSTTTTPSRNVKPQQQESSSGGEISSSSSSADQKILLGKYELGRLLGCGAFAKVYYARNIQTGQSVAIKSISKHKILKGGLMPNIKREITIMRRLRHPYIVKLYEVLATRTKIYFVMEFVKGGELFTKIAKCRFSEDLSRRYFQQLISAIGYCHSHGVFHRDLKPENLLLDERGDLKVSDFGLSAVTSQIRNDDDGMLHTLCGTPAYVAPEILTKKGYDGAKVDIWSCGIILFVLNAGYLPFNDPNLMAMYKKIYKGEYRCPKWTSPDLRRFLSRLLDTNPQTRISVDEILRDPWFKKGYREVKFHDEEEEEEEDHHNYSMMLKEEGTSSSSSSISSSSSNKFLNAFDIISYSSGFDLSGLFINEFVGNNSAAAAAEDGERFISAEEPEKIIKLVEELAMKENLSVRRRKKEWKLVLEGRNGKKLVGMEVYRLTEKLVVVEVRSNCDGIWKEKFSNTPEMRNLVYHPSSSESTSSGN